ncbi:unnamed protein product [Oikopleura dioica]|uniref:Uncharacterized protein n=1 Tax=Oikopleura dioica TaxID=34765 RepID=E4X6D8_OIKDI|nr:unnamed protein product [Oikopleura dioica]
MILSSKERQRCKIAQEQLGEKVAAFGDSYFYALSLNKKMCNGISRIKEENSMGSEFAESLLLFYNWETQGCSKAGYELVLDELERKPQLEASYSQLSDKILGMSDFERFDEETLEISGATFRALMEESATVAIGSASK